MATLEVVHPCFSLSLDIEATIVAATSCTTLSWRAPGRVSRAVPPRRAAARVHRIKKPADCSAGSFDVCRVQSDAVREPHDEVAGHRHLHLRKRLCIDHV